MIDTGSRPVPTDVGHRDDDVVAARPQVPTPTYFTSGPRATVDAAMAALSDTLERTLQEDLASGMVPTVEHLAVDVVREGEASGAAFVAVALVLLSYRHRL